MQCEQYHLLCDFITRMLFKACYWLCSTSFYSRYFSLIYMYYCVIVAFCQHEHAMICYIRFNRALTTLFYLVPRCQVSRFQSPSKKNTVRHGKKQPNLLSLSFFMFYLLFVLFNLDIILAYFFCFSPCVLALFTVFAFSGDFIIILLKTSFFFLYTQCVLYVRCL